MQAQQAQIAAIGKNTYGIECFTPDRVWQLLKNIPRDIGRLAARRHDGRIISGRIVHAPAPFFMAIGGGCVPINQLESWCKLVPKWTDAVENLIPNEGLDEILDKVYKGSGYTAAYYVLLTDGTPTVAAGDTLASHAGWVEISAYTGNRPAITLGAVSGQSVDNSASKAAFAINTNGQTIGGTGICTVATGTAGILGGVGAFAGGDKLVDDGDTLNVTITLTQASA